jgi:hypothetical protein
VRGAVGDITYDNADIVPMDADDTILEDRFYFHPVQVEQIRSEVSSPGT